jgi:hypothetical protein
MQLNEKVVALSDELLRLDPGDLAELRRFQRGEAGPLSYWRLAAKCGFLDDSPERWGPLVRVLAILTPKGEKQARADCTTLSDLSALFCATAAIRRGPAIDRRGRCFRKRGWRDSSPPHPRSALTPLRASRGCWPPGENQEPGSIQLNLRHCCSPTRARLRCAGSPENSIDGSTPLRNRQQRHLPNDRSSFSSNPYAAFLCRRFAQS